MEALYSNFKKIKDEILSTIQEGNYNEIPSFLEKLEEHILEKKSKQDGSGDSLNYKDLFEYSLAGLAIATIDQNIVDCNTTLLRILGYESLEEVQQYKISHFYADLSDRDKVLDLLKKEGSINKFELKVKHKNGETISALLNARKIEVNNEPLLAIHLVDISDQKRAEEKGQERQRLLQATLESTADGILVVDIHGKILISNQQFFRMWKIPSQYLNAKNDYEMVQYAAQQLVEPDEFLDKVKALSDSPERSLDTLRFKDGRVFERFSLPLAQDEKIMGRVWNFRDITNRIKTQEELKELNRTLEQRVKARTRDLQKSEQKYRDIFNSISDIFFRADKEGIIELVNPVVNSILGYKPEQVTGQFFDVFFSGKKEAEEVLEELFEESEVRDYETTVKTSDGSSRTLYLNLNLLEDNGEPLGFQGIIRDISPRVKLQKERDRLFDFSIDMFCIAGFDGEFKQINPAWTRTLGWQPSEMLHKPYIDFVHPADHKKTLEAAEKLTKGKPSRFFQNRYLSKSGEYKWISWSSFPFRGEKLIYAVARDITEQKKAEEALKKSEKQLQSLNAQKDKFFSIIAHDLQTPVGNFKQIADLLNEGIDSLDIIESKELIHYLQSSAKNTLRLLEDLMVWSRAQLGKIEVEFQEINVYALAVKIIQGQMERAKLKEISIVNQIEKGAVAYADQDSVSMVLRNILSNAIKFTPRNGKIRLLLSNPQNHHVNPDKYYVVAIEDNGIGIPEDVARNLFKIYENTHRPGTEDEKGTGLGLILCKELIEKNGGDIWVQSGPDKGSTFYFTLEKADK